MPEDTIQAFGFPAVGRKRGTAAFDGGRLTSDGGVMLLAVAERRIGLATTLAPLITDPARGDPMTYAMVDIYCASYAKPPAAVTLDIDDTVDIVPGNSQPSAPPGASHPTPLAHHVPHHPR